MFQILLQIWLKILNYQVIVINMRAQRQEKIFLCLQSLSERKHSFIFRLDPTSLPFYEQQIEQPMYLELIIDKFKQKQYQRTSQVYRDLNLIIENCMAYNRKHNPGIFDHLVVTCDKFKKTFDKIWEALMKEIRKEKITEQIFNEMETIEEKQKIFSQGFEDFRIDLNEEKLDRIQKLSQRKKGKAVRELNRLGVKHEHKSQHKQSQIYNPEEQPPQIKVKIENFVPENNAEPIYNLRNSEISSLFKESYCSIPKSSQSFFTESEVTNTQSKNINNLTPVQSHRKLRKQIKSLKQELEYILNNILTCCINDKIYCELKLPFLLMELLEGHQGESIQNSSEFSQTQIKDILCEPIGIVSELCDINTNVPAIHRLILVLDFVSKYIGLNLYGFETKMLVKYTKSCRQILDILQQISKFFHYHSEVSFINQVIASNQKISSEKHGIEIDEDLEQWLLTETPELQQIKQAFQEQFEADQMFIKTNLIEKKCQTKKKFFTLKEIQQTNNRLQSLNERKRMVRLHQNSMRGFEREDMEFIDQYSKRSNVMVVRKYKGQKLGINWEMAKGLHKLQKLEIRFDEEYILTL